MYINIYIFPSEPDLGKPTVVEVKGYWREDSSRAWIVLAINLHRMPIAGAGALDHDPGERHAPVGAARALVPRSPPSREKSGN